VRKVCYFATASAAVLSTSFLNLATPSEASGKSMGEQKWAYCADTASGGRGSKIALIIIGPFAVPAEVSSKAASAAWSEFRKTVDYGSVVPGYKPFVSFGLAFRGCSEFHSQAAARSGIDSLKSRANRDYGIIRVVDWHPTLKNLDASKRPETAGKTADDTRERSDAKPDPAEEARKRREARETEFQAKLAAHERQVADYQRKVEAREAEIARQQREQAAAKEAAAREKAKHARLIEEHTKRQMEFEAARNRHTACVNGDTSACANIAAGKPAPTEAKLADAGKASTDTDATRCVTSPEVFPSRVWKNTTEARVVNNCETAVDIVICLNRAEGWHCGVKMGVSPGAGMSWDARNGNGQVFWDARVMGSTKPLGRPS
jgi:hypothetical protein